MEHTMPACFYRVTTKGLVVQDGKLLMIKDANLLAGTGPLWELPGGGLDWGEQPTHGLVREIKEEMGLEVTHIDSSPIYVVPVERKVKYVWPAAQKHTMDVVPYHSLLLCYRIELASLDFTPNPECLEMQFFTKEELKTLKLVDQLASLPEIFNPEDFTKKA